MNTLWHFKFKSTTLLHDIENFHNVRPQERLQIVWNRNKKWAWDMWHKNFDPSPHKNMSPFWWTPKKGSFFTPLPLYGPMSPSQQFFFWKASLRQKIDFMMNMFYWMNTFKAKVTRDWMIFQLVITVPNYWVPLKGKSIRSVDDLV